MPGKRKTDWSKKHLTGEFHWSDCAEWKIHKYGSIFDIPLEVLDQVGWYQIEIGKSVTLPIQKLDIDSSIGARGGFNYNYYQLLRIDWEYLLERQSRLYASLNWGKEEIKLFHDSQLDWLEDRTNFLKEKELEATATELATRLGVSVEELVERLKSQKEEEEVTETVEITPPEPEVPKEPTGKLEKLGNEYFIYSVKLGGRYKIKDKNILMEHTSEDVTIEQLIGIEYEFQYDASNPPKSRNAKGWVVSLIPTVS